MNSEQFVAIMPSIVADLVKTISERQHISESESINRLYRSRLYADLEDEGTKVWHYGTEMLYSLFEEGEENGTIDYPDV